VRAVRRWVLRLLALLALGGVAYGVYTIVREGTEGGSRADRGPIQPALANLADSQEALAVRLEALRPGRRAPRLLPAIRAALRDREDVVAALHRRQAEDEPIPDEGQLGAALGAEFDYLDALASVARNRRSPLLRPLGGRAETAKDAFAKLPDSAGVEDGIRGTQAFIAWARARR
jgi:hypothetical protein